jgi:hypothetical protein
LVPATGFALLRINKKAASRNAAALIHTVADCSKFAGFLALKHKK